MICGSFASSKGYRSRFGANQWTRGKESIKATKSRHFAENASENSRKALNWTLHFSGMTGPTWLIPTASPWLFQGLFDEDGQTTRTWLKISSKVTTLPVLARKVVEGAHSESIRVANLWLFQRLSGGNLMEAV